MGLDFGIGVSFRVACGGGRSGQSDMGAGGGWWWKERFDLRGVRNVMEIGVGGRGWWEGMRRVD